MENESEPILPLDTKHILLSMVLLKNHFINPPLRFHLDHDPSNGFYQNLLQKLLVDNHIDPRHVVMTPSERSIFPISEKIRRILPHQWKLEWISTTSSIVSDPYILSSHRNDPFPGHQIFLYSDHVASPPSDLETFLKEIAIIRGSSFHIVGDNEDHFYKCMIFDGWEKMISHSKMLPVLHDFFYERILFVDACTSILYPIVSRHIHNLTFPPDLTCFEKMILIVEKKIVPDVVYLASQNPSHLFLVTWHITEPPPRNLVDGVGETLLSLFLDRIDVVIGSKNNYYLTRWFPSLHRKIILYIHPDPFPSFWNDCKKSIFLWQSHFQEKPFSDFLNMLVTNTVASRSNSTIWFMGSPHDHYLIMQKDGNLVVYDRHYHPVWASDTCSAVDHYYCYFQNDGNLVIYNQHSVPTWASHTWQPQINDLTLSFDEKTGRLVIKDGQNNILFQNIN